MLYVDRALACRLEMVEARTLADYARVREQLSPGSGASVQEIAGGLASFCESGFPVNRAVALGMAGPVSAAEIERVEGFYRKRGAPALLDLCPLADPSLPELLGRRGYRVARFFNLHVRELAPRREARLPGSEILITRVEPVRAGLWQLIAARGSARREEEPPDRLAMALAEINFHRPGVRCYLAWIGDEPAGAAALSIQQGIATLFSGSTRPRFRRQGVQTALIRTRLADAAAAGCELATVGPLPGSDSERNLQRAGFRPAYTRMVLARDWICF